MTYSTQRSLGGLAPVGVGTRAFSDPVLAKASLDASSIMLSMAKSAPERRLPLMQERLEWLGVGPGPVIAEMKRGFRPGANPDQVTFDALRLAIANARLDNGLDSIRQQAASRSGWDTLVDVGLGAMSANDRATGCMITSGAQTVGGIAQVVPVYGQIVGLVAGIGSMVAGQALDCGKEARDAAAAAAQASSLSLGSQRSDGTASTLSLDDRQAGHGQGHPQQTPLQSLRAKEAEAEVRKGGD